LPAGTPPPLARRIRLKLKRIYLDLTGPEADREWRRVWPLVDSIEGWLYPNEARVLFDIARSLPDETNVVEIGSYRGRSTCCLAFGCRRKRQRVFAIDTFDGGPDLPFANSLPDFSRNIDRCGLSDRVEPIVGSSTQVAKTWTKPIHLLFIDGSHAYEDALADFTSFFPHVVPGGTIAFHDVSEDWPGPLRAWHDVVEHQLTQVGYCLSLAYGHKQATALGDPEKN
jgi:MMP 1-O-methyltransferase